MPFVSGLTRTCNVLSNTAYLCGQLHGQLALPSGNRKPPAYRATLLHFSLQVIYNFSMAEKKLTGPASYFPSIEKKYGKPIEHWMKELKKVSKLAHMEQVAHLKDKFEMGHGHANAIVAVFRKKNGL